MADSGDRQQHQDDARDTASSHATPPSRASLQPEGSLKRKRGRQGCLNCRRKRKKCDEVKPTCTKCQRHQEICQWDTGVIFRHNGLSIEHPSMREASLNRQQQQQDFAIIDLTSSVARACREGSSSQEDGIHEDEPPKNNGHPGSWPLGKPAGRISTSRRAASLGSAESMKLCRAAHTPRLLRYDTGPYSGSQSASPDVQSHAHFKSPGFSDTSMSEVSFAHTRGPPSNISSLLNTDDGRCDPPKSLLPTDQLSGPNVSRPFVSYQNALSTPASAPSSDGQFRLDHDASGLSAGELAALDFLTSQPQMGSIIPTLDAGDHPPWMQGDIHGEPSPFSTDNILSPDSLGLYYPTSAYRDLQQNLHTHILETARNTGLTRQGTPDLSLGGSRRPSLGEHDPETISSATARLEFFAQTPTTAKHLTAQREIELWQNYLTEISPWLDKFDNKRHFELTVPLMAKTSDHLRYSILTLSARQQERKDPNRPYTESLGLYQEAIKHLVPELETINSAVIASCVLLCVLEMIIVSPKDWGRHLDGCAIMLQAANINGSVGGVNQALFWCFARMDVWGAYLSDQCTKIPLDRWLSSSLPMAAAVDLFKSTSAQDFDSYANYAVFLCASVVNVINSRGDVFSFSNSSHARAEFSARWRALFDLVEDWFASRPLEMLPLLSYPASSSDYKHPFPKILYGNPPAANGAQLYHFCAIRLLQEKPKDVRLPRGGGNSTKSLIWHARQICGIAASNTHHGAWINGLQPVWVAGRLMSHPCEHKAILEILERIERESGWATGWRAAELREYWGDADA